MGALTGFAHGTAAAKDPHAQGTLRLQENIIEYVLLICSPCEQPLFVETYCISGIKHQCEVESKHSQCYAGPCCRRSGRMCLSSQVQPDKEWQGKWGAAHSRRAPCPSGKHCGASVSKFQVPLMTGL